ncbi:lipopolysaccharide biosynthesis protein [Bacteroidota bacterium]
MFDRIKFTVKSTLIYSLGNIGIKVIGLILLPIYTEKFSTDEYGMWSILEITSQILVISFGLRLSTALIRFYVAEKDAKGKGKIIFTAFLTTLLSVVVLNLFTQFVTPDLSNLFFNTTEFASYFRYLFIWTSFEVFNQLFLDLIRVKEKPGFFILISLTKFIAVLLVIIYLIVYRGMGIEGIIIGQLTGSISLFLLALPFLFREMHWSFDLTVFRKLIRYGFPLIFSGISTFLLSVGDRYLVKYFLDYHEVGVYSLSYKFSNLVKILFIQAFQRGFLPIAFNMYDKPDAKRYFKKIFTYYVFMIFWVGLALSLLSKEIIYLVSSSETYYEAYKYIPLQTIAICFFGVQYFFMIGLHYALRTKIIAFVTVFVLAVNIGMNVLLIPRIGLYGAAITYIISGLLMLIFNYQQSQKYYPINYELGKVMTIIILSISLYSVSFLINDLASWLRISLKFLVILAYPLLLALFRFYEPVELERIMGAWKKWRNPRSWNKNIRQILEGQSLNSSDL